MPRTFDMHTLWLLSTIGCASSFLVVPRVTKSAPRLSLFPLDNDKRKGDDNDGDSRQPVEVIDLEEGSGASEKQPTDVYASRMTSDERDDDDDVIIDTKAIPEFQPTAFAEKTDYDVVIVGAGCAGVGMSVMLSQMFKLDHRRVICVEQNSHVGSSFRLWPEEMKFISPSFNQQGWTKSFDLNSVYWGTSPAAFLRDEHPSGEEYALYLETLADKSGIQVQLDTKVMSIADVGENAKNGGTGKNPVGHPGPFEVELQKLEGPSAGSKMTVTSRYVVWAAGEFQYPKDKRTMTYVYKDGDSEPSIDFGTMFRGAEYCLHNSKVKSWRKLPGDDFVIIGGYESGVDAAYNLAKAGKKCQVLASTPTWCLQTGDPSSELAPYTAARLREVLSSGFSPSPKLLSPIRVIAVEKAQNGKEGYNIAARWKKVDESLDVNAMGFEMEESGKEDDILILQTPNPPILATGFEGSVAAEAGNLFTFPSPADQRAKGCIGEGPLLTKRDESTKVPGVFLVGPSVTQ